jgi:hypothetical protein
MLDRISEPDWKVFKPLRELALERYCERALAEVERIRANAGKTQHQRYLEIWQILKKWDRELEGIFDYLRRSTALVQLAAFRARGLITDEEFMRFSAPTRDVINAILAAR